MSPKRSILKQTFSLPAVAFLLCAVFGTGPRLVFGQTTDQAQQEEWNKLTPEQKAAIEQAATIADTYFETVERDLEGRVASALQKAGVTAARMSTEDYLAWLALAQRTAWTDYVKTSTASKNLINTTMRVILSELASKEELVDAIFPPDDKN